MMVDHNHERVHRGQILVMFAFFSVVMVGMLGLATDLGFSFVARRSMQNAADGGALAGARIVAKAARDGSMSAQPDVQLIVNSNSFGGVNPTIEECQYVNDAGSELGSCNAAVPFAATGVTVTVAETHRTFFLRAIPGAPANVTVRATATAKIHLADIKGGDGPFIVCGVDTKLEGGGRMNLLQRNGAGQWQVNPDAYGRQFNIHGPQIERCDAKSSRFKGLNNQDENEEKEISEWFEYDEGTRAGPTRTEVEAIDGCKKGQEADGCIAYLPVAINDPPEQGNSKSIWVVAFVPFYIEQTKSNEHSGEPVPGLVIYNSGRLSDLGWTPSYSGPIAIRLST